MATNKASFNPTRVLGKGSISAFLFLFATESFSHLFRVANANRWVKGFSVLTGRGDDFEISHLFYGDDALIFVK